MAQRKPRDKTGWAAAGDVIKKRREEKHLCQLELANALVQRGVSWVSRMEAGIVRPEGSDLSMMVTWLGLDDDVYRYLVFQWYGITLPTYKKIRDPWAVGKVTP